MLKDFEKKLRSALEGHFKPRPFVCDGNPYICDVFIVGFNAATEMDADFWEFWHEEDGFSKGKWFDAYVAERAEMPLKPGKTRRNKVSSTRQRIEWIVTAAKPSNCLETNLYSKATPEAKDLSKDEMDSSVFELLLNEFKPKVIFSHGADARKHLELLSGITLPEGEVVEIFLFGMKTRVLSKSHLSRGWSKDRSIETGIFLHKLCTP